MEAVLLVLVFFHLHINHTTTDIVMGKKMKFGGAVYVPYASSSPKVGLTRLSKTGECGPGKDARIPCYATGKALTKVESTRTLPQLDCLACMPSNIK